MAHLLKKLFRGQWWGQILRRPFEYTTYPCEKNSQVTAVLLENRAHVKVKGNDAVKFLNGLVTNDINLFHCDSQISALYCMMLNVKGRVLYDLFVYKLKDNLESPGFLLECDSDAVDSILKTFKLYKLRSRVEFIDVSGSFSSWGILQQGCHEALEEKSSKSSDHVILVGDPRLTILGSRLVLPKMDVPSKYYKNVVDVKNQSVYDLHRVGHGVSEGLKDIEPGVALPLEYNITELHGVSYHKGCYIGQELTARTYHTGVIRKRIMPINLDIDKEFKDKSFDRNTSIKTTAGKAAGKLISTYGNPGLGLMRLDVVKSADGLSVLTSDGTNISVSVDWPSWWSHK